MIGYTPAYSPVVSCRPRLSHIWTNMSFGPLLSLYACDGCFDRDAFDSWMPFNDQDRSFISLVALSSISIKPL